MRYTAYVERPAVLQESDDTPRPVSPEGRWEERHRLVNYADDDLRAWIEEEVRRTGQSKTQVIVGTLQQVRNARTSRGRPRRTAKST